MITCPVIQGFAADKLKDEEDLKEHKGPSGDPKLLEQAWVCLNQNDPIRKIETIQGTLKQIPSEHLLLVLNPRHYAFSDVSFDALLKRAQKNDALVNEITKSKADKNGRKQLRGSFMVFRNTINTQAFIEEWLQQTRKEAKAQEGHPTLFSSLVSDFAVSRDFAVSSLKGLFPLPVQWTKTSLSKPLVNLTRKFVFCNLKTLTPLSMPQSALEPSVAALSPISSPLSDGGFPPPSPYPLAEEDDDDSPKSKDSGLTSQSHEKGEEDEYVFVDAEQEEL